MQFTIISAVALFGAILGNATPVPQAQTATTTSCQGALSVFGFARLEQYTVQGRDFSQSSIAAVQASGKYDNYGGPRVAGAFSRSDSLPGQSPVFVQAKNANYFYHKTGSTSDILAGLVPDSRYATYVQGDCSQFASNPTLAAACCQ